VSNTPTNLTSVTGDAKISLSGTRALKMLALLAIIALTVAYGKQLLESTPVESRAQSAYGHGAIKLECGEEYGFDIKRPTQQVRFVVPPGDCSTPWIGLPSFWQMPTEVSTAMVFEVRYRIGSSISEKTVALEVNPIDEPGMSHKPAFIRFRNPNAEPATVTLYFYY